MSHVIEAPAHESARVNTVAARLGAAPFLATVFLSAVLVFLVQPMFAKMATPLLGGAPNVWNVSLVCFQAALLLGYAYAHVLARFVASVRNQIIIHGALLGLAALVLPFQLSGALGEPDPSQPTLWLIGVFILSIAPPFAIISATAPLIQNWYSYSGRDDAHDPYHLYGASNIGSLLGLTAYPLLLEPLLPVAAQTQAWTLGYGLLAALLIISGLIVALTGQTQARAAVMDAADQLSGSEKPETSALWTQRAYWVLLAFVPSSLLVGVTTHIATDVASAPFLWAPPLMLYISSFIFVFAKRAPKVETSISLLPLAVAAAFLALPKALPVPMIVSFASHLAVLFIVAMMCHGLLAKNRPDTSRLTEFYLLMSLGGVLGGAFNALLAPVIFTGVTEYPLMLLAALLLRPDLNWISDRGRVWGYLAVLILFAALALSASSLEEATKITVYRLLMPLTIVAAFMGRETRAIPVLAAIAAWGIGLAANPTLGGVSKRGFFGVVKVVEMHGYRVMMHGTTIHGAQSLNETDRLQPMTYYAAAAPMGQIFAANEAKGRVGVVGLGTGSLACYARPGQAYTFYEIDPLVVEFARDPEYFSFLSDCAPDAPIILGDGRLSLAAEPEGAFELLLIDAFSSDSIPAHLLTREAIELYLSRLSDEGVLVLHISNNFVQLNTVVARIAGELNVPVLRQLYLRDNRDNKGKEDQGVYRSSSSEVVILARSPDALAKFRDDARWKPLISDGKRPWTDDYSNIVGAIWEKKVAGPPLK